jgi:hypothetical protein
MRNWKEIKVEGIGSIEKVVAEFHIWSTEKIPYGKFKVKIFESQNGSFTGSPNIAVKSLEDDSPDWIGGMGTSIEEALEDTLKCFMDTLKGREDLTEEDFEWSAHEDY